MKQGLIASEAGTLYVQKNRHFKLTKGRIHALKHRHSFMSWFIVTVVFGLCVNISLAGLIDKLLPYFDSVSVITASLTFMYAALVAFLIRKSRLPLENFGLTFANFWPSMHVAFWLSASIIVILIAIKMYPVGYSVDSLVSFFNQFSHQQLETNPFLLDASAARLNSDSLILYMLLFAPTQEFVVRSGLQSLFAAYLHTRYKNAVSIFLANFIFSSAHFVYGSLLFVGLTFIVGVFFSIMFVYYRSFWAVAFTHSVVGASFLFLFY